MEAPSLTCHGCGESPVAKYMNGWDWDTATSRSSRFRGNALCARCLERVQDDVHIYRPHPGYSKPGNFIVARQKSETVTGERAITLAIAYGNWLKALLYTRMQSKANVSKSKTLNAADGLLCMNLFLSPTNSVYADASIYTDCIRNTNSARDSTTKSAYFNERMLNSQRASDPYPTLPVIPPSPVSFTSRMSTLQSKIQTSTRWKLETPHIQRTALHWSLKRTRTSKTFASFESNSV